MSRKARVQRRRRAIGITGAVSAFLTLGLGALTDAPEAHADGFDVVIDQIFNAITSSWGDLAGKANREVAWTCHALTLIIFG